MHNVTNNNYYQFRNLTVIIHAVEFSIKSNFLYLRIHKTYFIAQTSRNKSQSFTTGLQIHAQSLFLYMESFRTSQIQIVQRSVPPPPPADLQAAAQTDWFDPHDSVSVRGSPVTHTAPNSKQSSGPQPGSPHRNLARWRLACLDGDESGCGIQWD